MTKVEVPGKKWRKLTEDYYYLNINNARFVIPFYCLIIFFLIVLCLTIALKIKVKTDFVIKTSLFVHCGKFQSKIIFKSKPIIIFRNKVVIAASQ